MTRIAYLWDMESMPRDPAEWREYMTDAERDELALAERVRDAAADQLRALTARLKARCLKRLMRSKD